MRKCHGTVLSSRSFLGMVINPLNAAKIGKIFCHTNNTESFSWMIFSMILLDFDPTPHQIYGKAFIQSESEGVSVSETLTPTLHPTLPLTLHPHRVQATLS